eukprot:g3769.t1
MKRLSLVFIIDWQAHKILLALKKRGFGAGKINGFGGKLENGETMLACAKRELLEESHLNIKENCLWHQGLLRFHMKKDGMVDKSTGKVQKDLHVSVFSVDAEALGDQVAEETEEMKPQWYNFDNVPFEKMWPDDKDWFPFLLEKKRFCGKFTFRNENEIEDVVVKSFEETGELQFNLK